MIQRIADLTHSLFAAIIVDHRCIWQKEDERGRDAVTYARRVIAEGGIVAVKGIGGFHLCCDATKESAVELLRTRKKRPVKPFAVMARNEEAVRSVCELSEEQERY